MTNYQEGYSDGAGAMLECRQLIEKILNDAPGLPLETCTPDELGKWTDAITGVLMNLGLARVVLDNPPTANPQQPQKEPPE